MPDSSEGPPVRVGILGASGYTGAEAIRLLRGHPGAEIAVLTANTRTGPIAACWPHLAGSGLPDLIRHEDADWGDIDMVFCGLPHGAAQEAIATLPESVRVLDMSADFRLRDAAVYEAWYGRTHDHPKLLREAVYGLSEHNRAAISGARIVACPGCYPTAVLLALLPLVSAGCVSPQDIIIDAKSGVTGAGRTVAEKNLFAEVAEGVQPYGVAGHRHAPEIEQALGLAAGSPVTVGFLPHLVPMNRGELVTIYAPLAGKRTVDDARAALESACAGENFVHLAAAGIIPSTRHVRGSNHCLIGVFADRLPGRIILVSALDNLVKGSAGQAVQNMNLMTGFAETTALEQGALFP